jgi:hypothetical protein
MKTQLTNRQLFTLFAMTMIAPWASVAVHAQNLLLNGSFELPVEAPNTYPATVPTNWVPYGDPPAHVNGVPTNLLPAVVFPGAEDGAQYIGLGINGEGVSDGLKQQFTVTNIGVYVLSWFDTAPDISHQPGATNSAPYSAGVVTNLNTSSNTLTEILVVTNDAYHPGSWQQHSLQMVLLPGNNYFVQFVGKPPIDHAMSAIDNVSLVRISPPVLSVATSPTTTSPTNLIISWPTSPSGFVLEATPNLSPPVQWEVVTNKVDTLNGVFSTKVLVDRPTRFFRLRWP